MRHQRRPVVGMLSRSRVESLLDEADTYGVVLMRAPAGSGKSVLAGAWAERERGHRPVAWLACSRLLDNPTTFWSEALVALESALTGLAEGRQAPPPPPRVPVERREILTSLLHWLALLPEGTVLICDDFHEVVNPDIHRDLQFVIDQLPLTLTLVIVSRSYPPLAMHRARLEGKLLDVRAEDLSFTRAETADLLRLNRIDLTDADVDLLHARTEGWAAGLRLAMISMAHSPDPAEVVHRLAESTDAVSGYLTEEVLTRLDPEDRDFLLQSCVAEELDPPLAARLTGRRDSEEMLERVAARIGFLSRTGETSPTYRYHTLFAALLRRELEDRDPLRFAEQHRRAALWSEETGDPLRAIGHAQEAGDWDLAARVAVTHAVSLIIRGRIKELEHSLQRFPQTRAAGDPRVMIVHAMTTLLANDVSRAERLLLRAQELLDAQDLIDARDLMDVSADLTGRRSAAAISYAWGLIARYRGDTNRFLELLSTDGPGLPGPDDPGFVRADLDVRAAWTGARAAALMWDDRTVEAAAAARATCVDVRSGAGGWAMVTGLGVIALVSALDGRLTEAEDAIDELARFVSIREWADAPYVAIADFAAAWVAMERCDFTRARDELDRADRRQRALAAGFPATMSRILRARLVLIDGDGPAAAGRALLAVEDTPASSARLLSRLTRQIRIEIALAEQDLDTASDLAAAGPPLLTAYVATRAGVIDEVTLPRAGDPASLVRLWISSAADRYRHDDLLGADQLLDRALELTDEQGLRLPYRQQGAQIRPVLINAQISAIRHGALVAELLSVTAGADGRGVELIDPLSPREQDVLRHLVAGQDTDEIASTLFLSRNTVRTHTKGIYRKLSVASRRDAVRRAAELGLI